MKKFLFAALATVTIAGCSSSMTPTASTSESAASSSFFAGYDAWKRGDLVSAERSLSAALAANPNDPYANLAMGSVMQQTGRADLAGKHWQNAITHGESTFPARSFAARASAETAPAESLADLARRNMLSL